MSDDWEDQFDAIEENLSRYSDNQDELIFEFLSTITQHFKERAIANAPIDTELLRNRMEASTPRREGDKITATVGTDVDYGLEIHEGQYPEGETYGLGTRTIRQPPTPEGGAGGGFLRRVSDYHAQDYTILFGVMMARKRT